MKKASRSSEERVADTYWPLVIHRYKTLYGPFIARIMAHALGCQPPSCFKADISKLEVHNIQAFFSPTYRRRLRNIEKEEWKSEVKQARREGIDVRQMARETFSHFYEGLREELSGSDIEKLSGGEIKSDWPPFAELEREIHRIDVSQVPKLAQAEAEQNWKAKEIIKDAPGAAEFFPIYSTIPGSSGKDARIRKEILFQVGGIEGYASTVADILAQGEINPLSMAESHRAKELLIRLCPLEKELEVAEFPQGFRLIGKAFGRFIKFSMTEQFQEIAKRIIGKMLIDQFVDHPYSKPRKVLPPPDNIERTRTEALWAQPCDLSEAEGKEAIIEALAKKGIDYNDLTPREWAEIFEKYDLLSKGYEFSSKRGLSISSFYGEKAHAKEQKWSRIKRKVRNKAQ